MNILNLTQHKATEEQVEAGVFDIESPSLRKILVDYLTFTTIPTQNELNFCARGIVSLAKRLGAESGDRVMIGGAPFFMSTLEKHLKEEGIIPVYAFSVRQSVEAHNPDGSVTKTNVFKHIGFVEM